MGMMTVSQICCRHVDVASPFESVQVAAQRMHARKVGTLVVVDRDQIPIGLITDRDLTVRVLAEGLDPIATRVHDVMTRHVQAITEEHSLEATVEVMRDGPFRRVVVVNDAGALIGVVSIDDILEILAAEFSSIGELLHAESPRSLAAE
jgi:CBS domain-containing protein